jgi:hypothetical protein
MAVLRSVVSAFAAVMMWLQCHGQDTVLVHSNNPPVWGENVQLVEDLRIGALDGADEYVFGRISMVAARKNGTIHTVDVQAPVILQYDSTGVYDRR